MRLDTLLARGQPRQIHPQTQFCRQFFIITFLLGWTVGFVPAPVQAIDCGDTLGPGGTINLTEDVGPCDGSVMPALTIIGPVTVEMNNFKVRCNREDAGDGILILGTNAEVYSGTVQNCTDGVIVSGGGNHLLSDIEARNNFWDGFSVQSANNIVRRSVADKNGGHGFWVIGDDNEIRSNNATRNWYGFWFEATDTTALGNIADDNDGGFMVVGGGQSDLTNNTASKNALQGFIIQSDSNTLTNNEASNNGQQGFLVINSDSNVLKDNTAEGGGSNEVGFHLLDASKNWLEDNTASSYGNPEKVHSDGWGFHIRGGEHNTLFANHGLNNSRCFYISESRENTLTRNTADSCYTGFYLSRAEENRLTANTATHHYVISFAVCGVGEGLRCSSPTARSFPVRSRAVSFPESKSDHTRLAQRGSL